MCITKSYNLTKEVREKLQKRGKLLAWKVVLPSGRAPCCISYSYQRGWNVALTARGKLWRGNYNPEYPRGIHVFLTREAAKQYASASGGERVIAVRGYPEDFVVAGHQEFGTEKLPSAVFRRVKISALQAGNFSRPAGF